MKVTINDVAREAGVSKSTVSRVLSNHERISEETKKHVQEVIDRLGYKPNLAARNLAKSQTRTIGIILPVEEGASFDNPIFIQMLQGISLYAKKAHYYIMYAFCTNEEEEKATIEDFCSSGMVDGLIILKSEENDKAIHYLKETDFPFVVIGRPGAETSVLWVDNDNFGATYELVEELSKLGHKEIAFLGAKSSWTVSKDRYEGYERALIAHGIPFSPHLVYQGEQFSEETGRIGIKKILEKAHPTAIIATDDLMAIGAAAYLREEGVEEIPCVGFNNTLIGAYQKPPISSVDIDGKGLGEAATKLLVKCIKNQTLSHKHKIIETKLMKRESFR